MFGDFAATAEHAGLYSGQIHAAGLQELAVVMEPPQIARLCKDGQGVDWTDAGNCAQKLIVRPIPQQFDSTIFDGITLSDETSALGQHHAEHADGV